MVSENPEGEEAQRQPFISQVLWVVYKDNKTHLLVLICTKLLCHFTETVLYEPEEKKVQLLLRPVCLADCGQVLETGSPSPSVQRGRRSWPSAIYFLMEESQCLLFTSYRVSYKAA